ncbi:hypothetical protein QEJ31_14690 [Pigmentibacter sp. JX0631]|uniref:hypothetical protein n=1 Tax=Pigmentibacter sp. JX0631 TaxID=2976982 RepID=UPI002468BE18|nr:hypothetical protein [Pigmentibacter sp. JX0631]WGL59777.1 hypothetical protein QEJ31_14690 [Pigmentibacter sp. JX0631]
MKKVLESGYLNYSENNLEDPFKKKDETYKEKKEKEDTIRRPVEVPIINPPRSPSGVPPTEEILKRTTIYI